MNEQVETGLSGVAQLVEPGAHNVVVVGSNPTPATNMPTGWTMQKTAAFIRDLAHNMYDLPFILKTHGVSQAQYDGIKDQEFFQAALRTMTIEWNSIGNTQKRLAIEAAIALEDAMPTLAARMQSKELLPGVVELAKLFAKVAGVGEATQNTAPSERFKITINLGADTQQFEKSRPTVTLEHNDTTPEKGLAVQ